VSNDQAADSSGELTWQVERLIGTDIDGRYRVEDLLGKGGMGAVVRAHHLFMDQAVAIKVLRPTLARDPSAARRFLREARGTLKVESEHAVKVLDFAITDDGLLYMVLELLEGRTVGAEVYDDGPMPLRRALRIARQVCDALAAAHRVALIHRDLKPDNIMLVRRGGDPDHVKVLDFGLAKVMEHAGNRALSMAALTQGDIVFGTPDYMAPEQALGQTLDGRSDIYALGCTLFEMLTGRPPFVGQPMAVLADHVRTPPPTLRSLAPSLDIPAEVEALVARCLAKDPAHRPASAEMLAAEIAAVEAKLGVAGRRAANVETLDLTADQIAAAVAGPRTASVPSSLRLRSGQASSLSPPPMRPHPKSGSVTGPWSPDDELARPRRNRAPMVILAIALAVAAVLVVIAQSRSRPQGTVSSDASMSTSITPDAGMNGIADAGPSLIDAAPGIDAAPTGHINPRVDPAAERLASHLAAADAARRSGNRLKQMAHADQALEIDRTNQRARWLMGDALVVNDRVNGCKYLRSASRIPAAKSRADAAGCP
jgi:serine/threonine-protein kinase